MPLTAAQIVTKACQIAHCPGFTQQGGQDLNLALNDLCLHRDLKMLRQEETIAVSSGVNGPFLLPANYLRTYDLFYTVNNFPYFLFPISQKNYDQIFKDPSIANYPYCYATDLTAQQTQGQGSLFIFPQTTSALSLTHRYMINMADIATPESSSTVPWFQDQDYLVAATALRLMKLTDDQRQEQFKRDCEGMLRIHLIMEGDEQQVVHDIGLDPRRFRINNKIRPIKLNPF